MSEQAKSEIMWAVWNKHLGFYTDTALTRYEMIIKHTSALGKSWAYARAKGDRCIKVKMSPLKGAAR